MAYTMLKFPDDPIAVVRIVLPLEHTLCAARHIWNQLNREADQSSEPFYTVLDLSAEQPDFSDILLWIDERRAVPTSRYRSPNMRTVLVGSHVMVGLAVRKFQRQLDVEITHCDTLDEALVHVHGEIAAARTSTHIA